MFYHLLYPYFYEFSALNVFRYITFRSFLSLFISFVVSLILGKFFIGYMQKRQFGQSIRDLGPSSHKVKQGTPTMGGVFIISSCVISFLFCSNFTSLPFLIGLIVLLSYFALGFCDDYLKILKKNSDGVSAKLKLLWQFATSFLVLYLLLKYGIIDSKLYFPFFKDATIDLGNFYMFFGSLVIVGSSNAVNLTDGLDGLAIGPIITSAACLGVLAYFAGHFELSGYLYIPFISGAGELVIFAAAIIGAGAGFLWYNSYPAQVFMGDAGSLSLGGALGYLAVTTKNELLFVLIGAIFVIEALSVIIQVGSFKLRGKRVFKMAPIHHHFELAGWKETKVIVRFWIFSCICAILAIASLKLR